MIIAWLRNTTLPSGLNFSWIAAVIHEKFIKTVTSSRSALETTLINIKPEEKLKCENLSFSRGSANNFKLSEHDAAAKSAQKRWSDCQRRLARTSPTQFLFALLNVTHYSEHLYDLCSWLVTTTARFYTKRKTIVNGSIWNCPYQDGWYGTQKTLN